MELASFGELFKASWELYKKKLSVFAMLMALPFALNFLLNLSKHNSDSFSTYNTASLSGLGLLLGLAFLIVTLWVQVASIKVADSPEDHPSVQELLSQSPSLILPYLWVSILVGLAVIGGLILLIIPGIIFALWFSLAPYAMVLDGKKGTAALKSSKSLVQGRLSAVFARGFLFVLVMIGVSIVTSLIFAIFPQALRAILTAGVSSFFATPLATVFAVSLYKELKKKPVAAPAPATQA